MTMKIYIKPLFIVALLLSALVSCSDDFLKEKKDYSGYNEQVYKDSLFAKSYVDYVYYLFLPPANSSSFIWNFGPGATGGGDTYSKNTDEFGGSTTYNQPAQSVWNSGCPEYFGGTMTSSISYNAWTRIREINLFFENIDNYGLPLTLRRQLKGQLYFWRAWQYFDLVRMYGGVPLILHSQDPITGSDPEATHTPRSNTSECITQICADLDSAKAMLPGKWPTAQWSRITKGAAAAFKGRVLLTYASPQFNRNDDVTRWQNAYDANLEAKQILEANGAALYTTGGTANGKAWGNMWFTKNPNPEAVIAYDFNNLTTGFSQKNNGWEKACRSKTLGGSGAIAPTLESMNAFPMADGKNIDETGGTYTYSQQMFYKNRDPRFYKTFVYNGAAWPYSENASFKQWTYRWYSASSKTAADKTTETLGANASGIYVCKGTDPGVTATNLSNGYSSTCFMEMRFAEVLLNLAECAVGINKTGVTEEGYTVLKAIRDRAGIAAGTNGLYGLKSGMTRDQLFAAILRERQIEFAFEGKRFWDLRRWMLFDESADGDNTNARLGIPVLNGTRRHGLIIEVKKSAYTGSNDPYLSTRDAANIDDLYTNNFEVKVKDDVDPTTGNFVFTWYKSYYFFGISQATLNVAPYLKQTIGWNGPNGAGDFDPLQ